MPIPQNVTRFMAQVDIGQALQDYAPFAGCVRLIGVSGDSFDRREFNTDAGCATYIIDLGLSDLLRLFVSGYGPVLPEFVFNHRKLIDLFGSESPDRWINISFHVSSKVTGSYAYETFTGEDPTYLGIESIAPSGGPTVAPPTNGLVSPMASPPLTNWELTAFHVGQGMCSLLQEAGGHTGYLLDAGAGTPVRRSEYRSGFHASGARFNNELMSSRRVNRLTSLSAFVSHADSDHWRLLDWDSTLLAAVSDVYLPSGAPALAFKSPRIKPKVSGVGSTHLRFNANNHLDIHRSQPAVLDSNGDCLVALVCCDQRTALLSGDYVYDRMAVDADAAISAAASGIYDGIVVPHHGDAASAKSVPSPANPLVSPAFFSAGTHAGYGHPTTASLLAHQTAQFDVIDRHILDDIIEYPLIP